MVGVTQIYILAETYPIGLLIVWIGLHMNSNSINLTIKKGWK